MKSSVRGKEAWSMIAFLIYKLPRTSKELRELTGVDRQTVHRIVASLAREGLLIPLTKGYGKDYRIVYSWNYASAPSTNEVLTAIKES